MSTSSTIPINLAIRAVQLHIAMCDAGADTAPCNVRIKIYGDGRDVVSFIEAARAGYKATLEFLLTDLEWMDNRRITELGPKWRETAAVRPLVEHLDQTRPNWRTE